MEFDNSFEVPLPPADAWPLLMDIPRIAPCMPGAELTEIVDDKTYRGKVSVRLGPVALAFAGTVIFEHIDHTGRTARVRAQGNDAKGRGAAQATATFRLEPSAAGSRVLVHTDLTLSGAVAQYGRGVGMIQATASALMGQFANNLKAQLARAEPPPAPAAAQQSGETPTTVSSQPAPAPPAPAPAPAKPISGLSLMAKVLWNAILRLFGGRPGA